MIVHGAKGNVGRVRDIANGGFSYALFDEMLERGPFNALARTGATIGSALHIRLRHTHY